MRPADAILTLTRGYSSRQAIQVAFRDGHDIFKRLAQADPGYAGWRRDLSVPFDRVGDVFKAQGNLPEALKSFRTGLAIRGRLAQSDPGNAGWQRDLAVSHERIGDMERRLEHPAEARVAFEHALAIYDSLIASNLENTVFLVSSTVPLIRQGILDADRRKVYFERALKILKDLDAAGRLEPARRASIPLLERELGR